MADDPRPLASGPGYQPAVLRAGFSRHLTVFEERFRTRRSYRCFGVLDGTATLRDGATEGTFRPGDALLLPPGGDRRLRFAPRSLVIHVVFDVAPVPMVRNRKGERMHAPGTPRQPGPREVWGYELPRRVPAELARGAIHVLHLIRTIYWRGPAGYARACGHLAAFLGDLAFHVAAEGGEGDRDRGDLPDPLRRALLILDDKRAAPPTVDEAARRVGISRAHLARLARDHLGVPLKDVVQSRRKAMACRLLLETDLPVARIAGDLGYRDPPSFHRAFHRWFGTTPAAFRRTRAAAEG